jgi:hypothetical protein
MSLEKCADIANQSHDSVSTSSCVQDTPTLGLSVHFGHAFENWLAFSRSHSEPRQQTVN